MGWRAPYSGNSSFLALLVTTPISVLLFYCTLADIRISSSFQHFVVINRPTVQFVVQLLASSFSVLQVMVLCRLINYGVRRRLASKSMTLDAMRFWLDAMSPRLNWELPMHLFLPLALFVASTMVLSAIWAAALTPVSKWTTENAWIEVPSWHNVTLVREYPSEYDRQGPVLRDAKGLFSYSVGMQFLGTLLASASSATSVDGSIRNHAKLDKSRFSYIGRSYGVASSVGLVDESLSDAESTLGYAYQETGYTANTKCLYNKTSEFTLRKQSDDMSDFQYTASGPLPDSDNGDESSVYIGHSNDSIVAIGVAHFAGETMPDHAPPRKYMAFAAGNNYDFLDKVQCQIEFTPTLFDIDVEMGGNNITVTPTNHTNPKDMDPTRRLKGTLLRQYELIANDETNLYISTVGAALNSSITDLRIYLEQFGKTQTVNESETVLRGIENAITVMADDMLEAYSGAQLMIGKFRQDAATQVRRPAVAIGQARYNYAVFFVNLVVILCVVVELLRTNGWKGLPSFDIADVRHLMVAASHGGSGLADIAFGDRMETGNVQIEYYYAGDQRFAIRPGREIVEKKDVDDESMDGHEEVTTYDPGARAGETWI